MMSVFALPLMVAALFVAPPLTGAQLYATDCASCHGAQQQGSADGPSLRGLGLADIDFNLKTGRMPAAVPWVQVAHRDERAGQALPLAQIRLLETYLAPAVAGGPPIPLVAEGHDLANGRAIYQLNCGACHAAGGSGGSLGAADWAPALQQASIDEIGDAIRAGSGQMPRFSVDQLSATDVNDVSAYVLSMQSPARGVPFHSTGPVPEGAVGYIAILALIAFVFVFWRNDTRPREREETVRRDEA